MIANNEGGGVVCKGVFVSLQSKLDFIVITFPTQSIKVSYFVCVHKVNRIKETRINTITL